MAQGQRSEMKIRWNQHSLRLRITPEELEALKLSCGQCGLPTL